MNRRTEAQDTTTSPERLHELTQLPGDRGDIDSDSGWCREYVSANPSAAAATLAELAEDTNDHLVRLHVAQNPSTPQDTVEALATDPNQQVSTAARERLGLPTAMGSLIRLAGGFNLDPHTGRVSR